MTKDFFPPRPKIEPKIYAYEDTNPQYAGLLKIGYTTKSVQERVAQQYPTLRPGEKPYRIVLEEPAIRNDGTGFTDHDVHRMLRINGIAHAGGEWFRCTVKDVKSAINAVRAGQLIEEQRSLNFPLRPEQQAAVEKTMAYFQNYRRENGKPPHFLWNCKMRFGKTFAAYQLAKRMGWKKMLVLTFKPAVQNAWEEDLRTHVDFVGWQFIKPGGLTYEQADKNRPIVCFGSFQDYLGRNPSTNGIKTKNEWVHATHWDCVIFDEYHFGAWREKAKDLFESEDERERKAAEGEAIDYFDEDILPITADHYLYLSGTPFRAIATGEFIEEQIYNWTYSDEQKAKEEWQGDNNPYAALPRMVLMTYQLPDDIRDVAMKGEFNEFDLNVFFSAEGVGEQARFTYEEEVQKWLDLIRGAHLPTSLDNLRLGAQKPPLPYSDVRLLNVLSHTLWFLPSVASCYAMQNLLAKSQNKFYHDYKVIVAAGAAAGIGVNALPPVLEAMGDPLKTKTITLTCGKLTTGVTVRPWTGIFMLRNTSSPETYFQAAFRVQSPWIIKNPDGVSPNEELILKKECYVFDFAPDRALRQIADYSCRLNVNGEDPERKVAEFIQFLPVLAYDGSSMKQIDAAGVLDMAMAGTTATLLARRWESALLVNVDDDTLRRLMNNEEAMQALMRIEGFRNLNQEIETIINKSEAVKKAKKEANDQKLSSQKKKQLTEEEKEFKSKRKQIQEKLIKFATRIPIFMYLTDYRERTLRDVITQLEPGLFKKVTGLTVKDFELLVSLGVFNSALMNDAVYKFKRYEDPSLAYTGINKHEGKEIGLYDTVLCRGNCPSSLPEVSNL
ncbi:MULTISPECIES: GIY-YIG nuclease family protein [unclassified Thermosynechococcus]|uniref:DEAD/DEAH box helicase n=1 Tax=unclassified Thermosynechococcus TaxID=2622553 RepID=UPI002877946C|nr:MULTISPECIES: GIY-YIG nuclease family protein [unclassified Thermosynechococcus]WNC53279.1 GIY-YIG nuclease family protein [Thermosynechococcus sp. TG215]WNC58371.1 GIY-YIG nuclease family protein [Thermosynechococcus sp. TG218]